MLKWRQTFGIPLTRFMQLVFLHTSWKHQKTTERKRSVLWNELKLLSRTPSDCQNIIQGTEKKFQNCKFHSCKLGYLVSFCNIIMLYRKTRYPSLQLWNFQIWIFFFFQCFNYVLQDISLMLFEVFFYLSTFFEVLSKAMKIYFIVRNFMIRKIKCKLFSLRLLSFKTYRGNIFEKKYDWILYFPTHLIKEKKCYP